MTATSSWLDQQPGGVPVYVTDFGDVLLLPHTLQRFRELVRADGRPPYRGTKKRQFWDEVVREIELAAEASGGIARW